MSAATRLPRAARVRRPNPPAGVASPRGGATRAAPGACISESCWRQGQLSFLLLRWAPAAPNTRKEVLSLCRLPASGRLPWRLPRPQPEPGPAAPTSLHREGLTYHWELSPAAPPVPQGLGGGRGGWQRGLLYGGPPRLAAAVRREGAWAERRGLWRWGGHHAGRGATVQLILVELGTHETPLEGCSPGERGWVRIGSAPLLRGGKHFGRSGLQPALSSCRRPCCGPRLLSSGPCTRPWAQHPGVLGPTLAAPTPTDAPAPAQGPRLCVPQRDSSRPREPRGWGCAHGEARPHLCCRAPPPSACPRLWR